VFTLIFFESFGIEIDEGQLALEVSLAWEI
jgi:hypothetical protein